MSRLRLPWRLAAFAGIAASEIVLASALYGFPNPHTDWSSPIFYANRLALILLLASLAFVLIAWPRRQQLAQLWSIAARRDSVWVKVLINLGVFTALLATRAALSGTDPQMASHLWYWGYALLVLGTGASVALIAAPISFWRELPRLMPLEIGLALLASCLVLLAAVLSKESWYALSIATLHLSHAILVLYEANPVIDVGERILGAEEFRVQIWPACSGYEGIGLIIAFLAIYLWVFRAHLRFPNAYCLFPIGIAVIWLLNSLRVALLVSIGAHVSPTMALEGFHSWSGWIAFIVVTAGIMVASRYSAFIWMTPQGRARGGDDRETRQVVAYLAPFVAFMAARILASTFTPHEQWFYPLTVVAIGTTLLWFWRDYAHLAQRVSWVSIVAGLVVGCAWILTDPQRASDVPLGAWLAGLPAALAVGWIALRAVGSVVLVPIAEELAFRGYLCRLVETFAARLSLTPGQVRLIALVVSSAAFGLLHERYVAAALSGAVYAALMYRTNRLSDPIAAHMSSNGAIIFWSVAAGQWTLL